MNNSHSKTRYFLFELVINCLIFAISAAVCLNLFAFGFIQNQESRDLSMATLESQSIAETFKASGGNIDLLGELLQNDVQQNGTVLYYDRDWNRVSAADTARHSITLSLSNDGKGLYTANILVKTDTETIYELLVQQYHAEEGSI